MNSERISILHISPQPDSCPASVCLVSDKLTEEFSSACRDIVTENVRAEDALPLERDLEDFDGLVISGSVHSVYDKSLDWMPELERLIQVANDRRLPTLGSCYGHQAIVQALGGRVEKGTQGMKLGYFPVLLTDAGKEDPIFKDVEYRFTGTSWHEDIMTQAPNDSRVLAIAEQYGSQALAIAKHVRTTQFHPEFSSDVFEGVLADTPPDKIPSFRNSVNTSDVNKSGSRILQNFATEFVIKNKTGNL